MRCQHVDNDVQCHAARVRRCGDPPDPARSGFAGTIYTVHVCDQHDPDPRRSIRCRGSRLCADRRTSQREARML
jgi:hypothetical protein